jgi:hypothetical protein
LCLSIRLYIYLFCCRPHVGRMQGGTA